VSDFNFYPINYDKSHTKAYQPFIFQLNKSTKKLLNINLQSVELKTDVG